ncbi:MAG: protein kinase [bacterium]|nr:protein kinase [bacterium]
MDTLVGRTLADYRLVEQIGEGGMATVFKAVKESLGRTVALKVLKSEITTNPGFLKRFHNEIQTVSVLKEHPNISYPYTSGEENGHHFMVMEYIDGPNIRDIIRKDGYLSVRRSLDIAVQVCEALGYAHDRGIVHRDVKPANIMVTRSGEVKVTDFGIARTRTSERLTVTGVIIGTPVYMSPEQAAGKRTDHRADIYAVGVLLYEMLAGEVPFKGQDLVSLVYQISTAQPEPLTELVPDIPPALAGVVAKAMEKERENRYQSIKKLKKELARVQRNIRLSALPKRSSCAHHRAPRKTHSSTSAAASGSLGKATATFVADAPETGDNAATRIIAPTGYQTAGPVNMPSASFGTARPSPVAQKDTHRRFGVLFFSVLLALCLVGGSMYGWRQYRLKKVLESARDSLARARYQEVVKNLTPLVRKGTITPELQSLLGLSHFKIGQYGQALEHMKAAVVAKPGNALYHFNLAMVYEKLDARPAAVKHFKKAIDLDPGVVMFYDGFCEWVLAATKRYEADPIKPYLGLKAVPAYDSSGDALGIKVTMVDPGSASARVIIRPGDVVTHIEGMKITALSDVRTSLKGLVPGEALLIRILRDDRVVYYNFMTGERSTDSRKGYF